MQREHAYLPRYAGIYRMLILSFFDHGQHASFQSWYAAQIPLYFADHVFSMCRDGLKRKLLGGLNSWNFEAYQMLQTVATCNSRQKSRETVAIFILHLPPVSLLPLNDVDFMRNLHIRINQC